MRAVSVILIMMIEIGRDECRQIPLIKGSGAVNHFESIVHLRWHCVEQSVRLSGSDWPAIYKPIGINPLIPMGFFRFWDAGSAIRFYDPALSLDAVNVCVNFSGE